MSLPKLFSNLVKRKPQGSSHSAPPHAPGPQAVKPAAAPDIGSKLLDGVALHKQGQLLQAEAAYREILRAHPGHFDSLHYLGLIALQRGKTQEGIALIEEALKTDDSHVPALANLAMALRQSNRHEEALALYHRAIGVKPDAVELQHHLANALLELQRYDEALQTCSRAIGLHPKSPALLQQRGTILLVLRRFEEAIADFDRALALDPGLIDALANRGLALGEIGRGEEAIATYDQLLQRKPDDIEARFNRANIFRKLGRFADAIADYERVLHANPDHVGALNNLGITYSELGRFESAIAPYRKLATLMPENGLVLGTLFFCQLYGCDWQQYEELRQRVVAMAKAGEKVADPFRFLNASGSAAEQMECASAYVASKFPAASAALWNGERYQHERIRIAYLSADFQEHATAHLTAGMFETHDKQRFETIAISFGPDASDAMRQRLQASFDRFIDVREKSDLDVARLLRELEVDILVDLKGFTGNGRLGILAHRPAPVQVSYLGYPGTSGASYIDYLVADKHLIRNFDEQHYSEKVVFLPDSYQVNDAKRPIAESIPTRAQAGLPESGFVFCSFNNNYKITPAVFDIWMRLLQKVPGSVLWLYEGNAIASANLRREAQTRGIAPERLVFAPRMAQAEHLARQKLADLFLDTLPINAHTTASDALWAGLPVLTCSGGAFAGRVAGSLLHAVGLPELVTDNLEQYENLALRLATSPSELGTIREKLAKNRTVFPLFDTTRFCRHLESAYIEMWKRYQQGELPSRMVVTPLPDACRASAAVAKDDVQYGARIRPFP